MWCHESYPWYGANPPWYWENGHWWFCYNGHCIPWYEDAQYCDPIFF